MNESVQKEAAAVITKAIEKLPSEALVASLALVTISIVAISTRDGYNTTASAAFVTSIALAFLIFRYRLAIYLLKNRIDSKVDKGVWDRLAKYGELLAPPSGGADKEGDSSGDKLTNILP